MSERYLPRARSLQGTPVTVTGATGFIGGRLAQRLAAGEGARVTGTGRELEKARRLEAEGVSLARADLLEPRELREAVEGSEVVFHAAAWLGGDDAMARPVNVEGTENVVTACLEAGVRRLVHVSTVGVYRLAPDAARVDEEWPLAPDSAIPYSATKAEAELRARELVDGRGLELAVVRPAMVYGPRSSFWSEGICRAVCAGKPVMIGEGEGHFHPIFVDNLVDALLLCAVDERAAGQAFNVVEEPVTWYEYAGRYGELCGAEPASLPLWMAKLVALAARIPGLDLPIDRERLLMATNRAVFDTSKLRKRLGWEPRIGLDEGMERTATWLREKGVV